ncbi:UDP-N-acetyl-D-mannosaminuronic acid dehydrogenase [Halorubrum aidingense JCM 13560]|uniref:UDP-N-acetyl-D-mannosamine dehydrogenase n=1 Tax=Halorubrum aidingense JCM 13560 TaxID=1230454 RepID=M0PL47_9EURY|nr:nucleotide sugar dehydrogenase [Halorubrum aidingense]EMA70653.1 UDP-N-acetyl-D-mannosaminuronic acid dehydrogenase [Halorubrum aidingense JCM 13560]
MSQFLEPNDRSAERQAAFESGDVPVAVYGLGKMGLPLAAVYAEVTGNVTGVDIDESVVERIRNGECPVEREPGLPELVSELVEEGALTASSDPTAAAADAAVHVVIVPTLVDADNQPDLSAVRSVVTDIAQGLDPGDLLIVESTLPPGTTENVLWPLVTEESGLNPDAFGIAFCPERTSSGRALQDIRGTHPKIVGGATRESTQAAADIYGTLVDNDIVTVADATTAEMVKVFEGLYRDVNIALANELARFADELDRDVREAIAAANTQPYCDLHIPGPGVGGHCIPYYPYFVINWLTTDAPLLETSRSINDAMPGFVADKALEGLAAKEVDADDATALVLGLTYRAGVRETRASPAYGVCERLSDAGVDVLATDPLVSADGFDATDVPLTEAFDSDLDAVVLVTAHEEFDAIDWDSFDEPLVVVDGRDALELSGTDHLVYTVGRGYE